MASAASRGGVCAIHKGCYPSPRASRDPLPQGERVFEFVEALVPTELIVCAPPIDFSNSQASSALFFGRRGRACIPLAPPKPWRRRVLPRQSRGERSAGGRNRNKSAHWRAGRLRQKRRRAFRRSTCGFSQVRTALFRETRQTMPARLSVSRLPAGLAPGRYPKPLAYDAACIARQTAPCSTRRTPPVDAPRRAG